MPVRLVKTKTGRKQMKNPRSPWRRWCAYAVARGSETLRELAPRLTLKTLPLAWKQTLASQHLSLGMAGHTTKPGAFGMVDSSQLCIYNLEPKLNNWAILNSWEWKDFCLQGHRIQYLWKVFLSMNRYILPFLSYLIIHWVKKKKSFRLYGYFLHIHENALHYGEDMNMLFPLGV